MARLSTEINGDGSCAAVMPGESSTTTTNTTEDGGENSRDESANTTTNPSSVASSSVKSEAEEGGDQEIGQSVIRKNRYQKKQTSPHDAEDANDFENPPDPEAYEKLEFTAAAKEAMVSLLNAFMPELPEALEVPLEANTANLYFRLGSLAQFFNAMFAVPELLYIKDLPPMPSAPRHMNETRIANVHRYIRFWLTQFYACDDVIGKWIFTFTFFLLFISSAYIATHVSLFPSTRRALLLLRRRRTEGNAFCACTLVLTNHRKHFSLFEAEKCW